MNLQSPEEMRLELAHMIKAAREREGWTQVETARRAGLSERTFRILESTGQGSILNLLKIVGILGDYGALRKIFPESPYLTLDQIQNEAKRNTRK